MLDALQRQLAEALFANGNARTWLLFDAIQRDVRACLPEGVPGDDIHVIELDRDDIPDECSPHLIGIGSHDVERIRASLEVAMREQGDADLEQESGFAIGGWLASDAQPATLARHLSRCMKPRLNGVGRKYFRWADRRVFEWMWRALDENERAALLGPVTAWWTLDRCDRLVEHKASTAAASNMPWQLTDISWKHAQDCEPVQTLLRGWQRFTPELPNDYLARATNAARGARSLGLAKVADIVLMGTYVLQIHPDLCAHPALRTRVADALQSGRSLLDALAEVPDPEGWDTMRDELINPRYTAVDMDRSLRHG